MESGSLSSSQNSPSHTNSKISSPSTWDALSPGINQEVNLSQLFINDNVSSNMFYFPQDPFSDPFIPFGSLDYLEVNNIFSSSDLSKVSSPNSQKCRNSLGLNYPSSESPNPMDLSNTFDSGAQKEVGIQNTSSAQVQESSSKPISHTTAFQAQNLIFPPWDELGQVVTKCFTKPNSVGNSRPGIQITKEKTQFVSLPTTPFSPAPVLLILQSPKPPLNQHYPISKRTTLRSQWD